MQDRAARAKAGSLSRHRVTAETNGMSVSIYPVPRRGETQRSQHQLHARFRQPGPLQAGGESQEDVDRRILQMIERFVDGQVC